MLRNLIKETKEMQTDNPGQYAYHITVKCIAPGREVEEIGSCDTSEKPNHAEHIIRSMAVTRAKSRAIATMIGASEMSAEEMEAVKESENDDDVSAIPLEDEDDDVVAIPSPIKHWCPCTNDPPHVKFQKNPETNLHHCYDCNCCSINACASRL